MNIFVVIWWAQEAAAHVQPECSRQLSAGLCWESGANWWHQTRLDCGTVSTQTLKMCIFGDEFQSETQTPKTQGHRKRWCISWTHPLTGKAPSRLFSWCFAVFVADSQRLSRSTAFTYICVCHHLLHFLLMFVLTVFKTKTLCVHVRHVLCVSCIAALKRHWATFWPDTCTSLFSGFVYSPVQEYYRM